MPSLNGHSSDSEAWTSAPSAARTERPAEHLPRAALLQHGHDQALVLTGQLLGAFAQALAASGAEKTDLYAQLGQLMIDLVEHGGRIEAASGIAGGATFFTFPAMMALLLPIILLEAWLCRKWLGLDTWTALKSNAVANAASTLIGVPLAFLLSLAEMAHGDPQLALTLGLAKRPELSVQVFSKE